MSKFDELNAKQFTYVNKNSTTPVYDVVAGKLRHVKRPTITRTALRQKQRSQKALPKLTNKVKTTLSKTKTKTVQHGKQALASSHVRFTAGQEKLGHKLHNLKLLKNKTKNRAKALGLMTLGVSALSTSKLKDSINKIKNKTVDKFKDVKNKVHDIKDAHSYQLGVANDDGLVFHKDENGVYYTASHDTTFSTIDANGNMHNFEMPAGARSGYINAKGHKAKQYLKDITHGKIPMKTYIGPNANVALRGDVKGLENSNALSGDSRVKIQDGSLKNVHLEDSSLDASGKQQDLQIVNSKAHLYADTQDSYIYDSKVDLHAPSQNWSSFGSRIHNQNAPIKNSYVKNADVVETSVTDSQVRDGDYYNSTINESDIDTSLDTSVDGSILDKVTVSSPKTRTASLNIRHSVVNNSTFDLSSSKDIDLRFSTIEHGHLQKDVSLTGIDAAGKSEKMFADNELSQIHLQTSDKADDVFDLRKLNESNKRAKTRSAHARLVKSLSQPDLLNALQNAQGLSSDARKQIFEDQEVLTAGLTDPKELIKQTEKDVVEF